MILTIFKYATVWECLLDLPPPLSKYVGTWKFVGMTENKRNWEWNCEFNASWNKEFSDFIILPKHIVVIIFISFVMNTGMLYSMKHTPTIWPLAISWTLSYVTHHMCSFIIWSRVMLMSESSPVGCAGDMVLQKNISSHTCLMSFT